MPVSSSTGAGQPLVVNLGNATCADVVSLTEQVRQVVLEKTGCTLEREIRVVE